MAGKRSSKVDEKAVIKLIINGEQAKASLRELRLASLELDRQLANKKKVDDPAGFEELRKNADLARRAVAQTTAEIRGSESSWAKFKVSIKDIAIGTLGGNALTFLATQALSILPNAIQQTGELSDQLADIQKQTGLTGEQVGRLNDRLGEIDTRTPRKELRELAAVAGKLGYTAENDVLAFVKAADMINVSLGEDLGGNIEEVVNDMGKLTEIFGLTKEFGIEKAMIKTASAINTIGASSAANEGYLVAWSKRFAGIAPNAGMSIADTLGLAATMDILGQSSELSATNVAKMIVAIGRDVPHFAKVARMSVKDFSTLLKTDANEAFLRVLEGAKSAKGGLEGMVKTLENLGIEGSEGAQVLGALTKNTELLRKQQDIANSSFDEGTSVINEFNIKNNNTAAIIEKLGKKFTSYFTIIKGGLDPVIHLFGRWFGIVDELEEQLVAIENQQAKLAASEKNLTPLVDRYNQLGLKVKKTKEEQQELATITKQLAEAVPGAVTQWDAYGNALAVDTTRVVAFVSEQRKLLEVMRLQRMENAEAERNRLKSEASVLQRDLNRGQAQVGLGMGQYADQKLTGDGIAQRAKRLAQVQQQIKKLDGDLARLDGKVASAPPPPPPTAPAPVAGANDNLPTKEEEKQAIKDGKEAAKTLDDIRADILKARQQITQDSLSEGTKEIQAAQHKYAEMRKEAKGHTQEMAEIDEIEKQDLEQIRTKYAKKELSEFDKAVRGQLKAINEAAKEKNAFQQKISDSEDEMRFGEVAKVEAQYAALIAQAELYGLETVGLYTLMADAINAVRQKQAAKEIETETERQEKLHDIEKKALDKSLRIIDQKKQIYSDIAEGIGNLFLLMAENETQYADFQKAISLVQLAIDSGAAIAAAVRVATTAAPDPLTLITTIAAAVATVTGSILKGKQLIQKAEVPAVPAFRAAGGSTSLGSILTDRGGQPEGWVRQPTLFSLGRRSYVAGEAGEEYVLSNPMLQNPVVADFVGMMESLRQQNAFANPRTALPRGGSTPAMDPQLAETNRLLRLLVSKPGMENFFALEEKQKLVDSIRSRASA